MSSRSEEVRLQSYPIASGDALAATVRQHHSPTRQASLTLNLTQISEYIVYSVPLNIHSLQRTYSRCSQGDLYFVNPMREGNLGLVVTLEGKMRPQHDVMALLYFSPLDVCIDASFHEMVIDQENTGDLDTGTLTEFSYPQATTRTPVN